MLYPAPRVPPPIWKANRTLTKRLSYDLPWLGQHSVVLILTSLLVSHPLSEKKRFFHRARKRTWFPRTRSDHCTPSSTPCSWKLQSSYYLVCTNERSFLVGNLKLLILVQQNSKNRLQFPWSLCGALLKATGNRRSNAGFRVLLAFRFETAETNFQRRRTVLCFVAVFTVKWLE